MSKIELFRPQALSRPDGLEWDAPSEVWARWAEAPMAQAGADEATISILDPIGNYGEAGGVTARRIEAALRAIGPKPVTVAINSPGGDMFEGLAIYNLLASHPEAVRVRVLGLAASAASIIAMAGDQIELGTGALLMIHNSWGLVVGDQAQLRSAADLFATFDGAMAQVYAHRTGLSPDRVAEMMTAETWMTADEAIREGFATGTFDGPAAQAAAPAEITARRRLDAILAKTGLPRSERRRLLREAAGTPGAAGSDTPRAVALDLGLAAELLRNLRS